MFGNHIVRVLALGQKGEFEAASGLQQPQRGIDRPESRLASGCIAVETQHWFVSHAPERLELVAAERGAERRHRIGKACLRQRNHIHIAFNDNDLPPLIRRLARRANIEQHGALVKQRRLGRVHILCPGARCKRAPAKGNHPVLMVADGENQPLAKPVIGNRDIIPGDDKSRLNHRRCIIPLPGQMFLQAVTVFSAIAETKRRDCFTGDPAPVQILAHHAAGTRRQLLFEKDARRLHGRAQPLAALLALLVPRRGFGHLQPGLARQTFDAFWKRQPFGFLQEGKNVAMLAAGEAVIKALLVIDREGGRLFLLERAQSDIFTPLPL